MASLEIIPSLLTLFLSQIVFESYEMSCCGYFSLTLSRKMFFLEMLLLLSLYKYLFRYHGYISIVVVAHPMGTYCAPLLADYFLFS